MFLDLSYSEIYGYICCYGFSMMEEGERWLLRRVIVECVMVEGGVVIFGGCCFGGWFGWCLGLVGDFKVGGNVCFLLWCCLILMRIYFIMMYCDVGMGGGIRVGNGFL